MATANHCRNPDSSSAIHCCCSCSILRISLNPLSRRRDLWSTDPVPEPVKQLLALCHEIGREDRGLAVLAEGNCSARIDDAHFAIKASGCSLATLTAEDLTLCDTKKVLAMVDQMGLDGAELEKGLMNTRVDGKGKRPSIETAFHSWLLQLDDAQFVGHCHPLHCNMILCSHRAEEFATKRLFPDEVVCCGSQSVFVPYSDPGLTLAREIQARVLNFLRRSYGPPPRLILLQNHGIIAVGSSAMSVLATLMMAEKAARIFVGAASLGGPVFLPAHLTQRIGARPHEAHRQPQIRVAL
ncbi:MAG: class II aldolase/adducin family protein [Pedosphaera sp.]|nr:class II aldolase/adducin family protein [Pedosphaera sp.]